ncbi:MAG: hypothetical protein V7849_12755, partial [Candidatus Competibacter sp.]
WSEPGQDGVSLLERALKNGSTWISDSSDGYATNSCRRGLSTPPTMLLKRVDLRRERVLIHTKDHVNAILVNLNAFDQGTDQLPTSSPVELLQARGDFRAEFLQPANDKL